MPHLDRRTLAWVAVCPLPAVLVGAVVARTAGVPAVAFAPNVVGVVLGIALLVAALRTTSATWLALARWIPPSAALAVISTLLFTGSEGAQRWMAIGPVAIYVAPAVLPWLLLDWIVGPPPRRHGMMAAISAAVFVAQPDAAAATTLAAAALPLVRGDRTALLWPALACAAAWAWRVDVDLSPVPHVEGIVGLAAELGPLGLAAALLALGVLALPALACLRVAEPTTARVAIAFLASLFAAWIAAAVAAYPVGLLGAGIAPVLGWYGFAAVLLRTRVTGTPPRSLGPA